MITPPDWRVAPTEGSSIARRLRDSSSIQAALPFPKGQLFQVRLQVGGGHDQQPALAVRVVMGQPRPGQDLGIYRFDDTVQRRQDRGLFSLAS